MKDTNSILLSVRPTSNKYKSIRHGRKLIKTEVASESISETQSQSVQTDNSEFDKEFQIIKQPKHTLYLFQHIFTQTRYNTSTYMMALQILTCLQIQGGQEACIRIAGTLLLIAGKMNETIQIPIQFIIQWSSNLLKRQHIIDTQGIILKGLDFHLPTIDFENQNEIKNHCKVIQAQIQKLESGQSKR